MPEGKKDTSKYESCGGAPVGIMYQSPYPVSRYLYTIARSFTEERIYQDDQFIPVTVFPEMLEISGQA